jgi:hypothetical protein
MALGSLSMRRPFTRDPEDEVFAGYVPCGPSRVEQLRQADDIVLNAAHRVVGEVVERDRAPQHGGHHALIPIRVEIH